MYVFILRWEDGASGGLIGNKSRKMAHSDPHSQGNGQQEQLSVHCSYHLAHKLLLKYTCRVVFVYRGSSLMEC